MNIFLKTFLIFLVLLTGSFAFGQGKTPREIVKSDWPNLVASFGKNSENVPSHYIFVVDVTEEIFGPEISSQIQSFVDALPANDKVTVIQLGPTNETMEIVPTCNVTAELKKDIIDKLKRIQFGRNGSDGLKMADCVINSLNAPGVSNFIPFVFIFSDYEFFLPGKGYFVPATNEWKLLNEKFEKVLKGLKRGNNLSINGLRLKNPRQKNDYFDKLQVVFGKISPSTVSGANLLKTQFNNIQADIYRKRLLNYIKELLTKQNSNIQLENVNKEIILNGSDTLVYHKLKLDDESQSKVSQILKSDKLFSLFPPSMAQFEVSGTLIAEKYKNELPELADIELKNQKISLMIADSLIPWWLTDIMVLILVLIILRFIWTFLPVHLHGMITFSSADNLDLATFNTNCSGKKTIMVGYGQAVANDANLFGSDNFSLKITACRKFIKGRCLVIEPTKGDLKSKRGNIVIQKSTKSTVGPNSRWAINGIDIGMPGVK